MGPKNTGIKRYTDKKTIKLTEATLITSHKSDKASKQGV